MAGSERRVDAAEAGERLKLEAVPSVVPVDDTARSEGVVEQPCPLQERTGVYLECLGRDADLGSIRVAPRFNCLENEAVQGPGGVWAKTR
jgi:hypothetical protein